MTKFEVKYYEIAINEKGEQYEKITTDVITARLVKLEDGMAVFYENGGNAVIKAIYPSFIYVKEL